MLHGVDDMCCVMLCLGCAGLGLLYPQPPPGGAAPRVAPREMRRAAPASSASATSASTDAVEGVVVQGVVVDDVGDDPDTRPPLVQATWA
jgi:hypothetical protein